MNHSVLRICIASAGAIGCTLVARLMDGEGGRFADRQVQAVDPDGQLDATLDWHRIIG